MLKKLKPIQNFKYSNQNFANSQLDPSLICSTKLQHGAALTFGFLWDFRSNRHVCKYWLESKLRTHITVRQKPKMGKVNVVTDVATVVVDIIKNKLCKHAKGKLFNFEATSA